MLQRYNGANGNTQRARDVGDAQELWSCGASCWQTPHFQLEVGLGLGVEERVGQNNLPSVLRVFHRGRS